MQTFQVIREEESIRAFAEPFRKVLLGIEIRFLN